MQDKDSLVASIMDFAQFLASQSNADELKKEFDEAYQIARHETRLKAKHQKRQLKTINDCPRMSEFY